MALEGTLKNRNGKLYVLYTYDEYSEPFRQYIWYRVLETRGSGYGDRPEAGDTATSTGHGGEWKTHDPSTHRTTGSVSTGTGSTQAELVERVSINPPPAGGKELRWRDGRWEKLMARGWMPAGEGKTKPAKAAKKPSADHAVVRRGEAADRGGRRRRATKKSPAQLQREIDEVLAKPPSASSDRAVALAAQLSPREREALAWLASEGLTRWRHGARPNVELGRLRDLGLARLVDREWGEFSVTPEGKAVAKRLRLVTRAA